MKNIKQLEKEIESPQDYCEVCEGSGVYEYQDGNHTHKDSCWNCPLIKRKAEAQLSILKDVLELIEFHLSGKCGFKPCDECAEIEGNDECLEMIKQKLTGNNEEKSK